ncbi:unnamed protein product [Peniophora sp. CBMAI 1063]|nr:unnamed protein product [Peniophora sp. CBMAI 1063]
MNTHNDDGDDLTFVHRRFGSTLKISEPCAIDKLFDDNLTDIFLHLDPCSKEDHKETRKGWHSVPAVCRRWRRLALSLPQFWSSLLFTNPDLTDVMLERSQHAPLHVVFPGPESWYSDGSQVLPVIEHLDRVAFISLSSFVDTLHIFTQAACRPAPILRTCILRRVRMPAAEGLGLPPDFLGGNAPQLETLILRGCCLPWTSPLLHGGITTLHLQSLQTTSKCGINAMLDALSHMHNLKDLRLSPASPYWRGFVEDVESANGRSVTLPHIVTLYLTGTPLDICGLLPLLALPYDASTHLSLIFSNEAIIKLLAPPPTHGGLAVFDRLHANLARHFASRISSPDPGRATKQPQPGLLELHGKWPHTYALRATSAPTPDSVFNVSTSAYESFSFPEPAPPEGFTFTMALLAPGHAEPELPPLSMACEPLVRAYPLEMSALETLLLTPHARLHADAWCDIAIRARSVRRLVIEALSAEAAELLALVQPEVRDHIGETEVEGAPEFFPALTHLSLVKTDLKALAGRWRRRLRVLRLQRCWNVADEVRHLRTHVETVIWEESDSRDRIHETEMWKLGLDDEE